MVDVLVNEWRSSTVVPPARRQGVYCHIPVSRKSTSAWSAALGLLGANCQGHPLSPRRLGTGPPGNSSYESGREGQAVDSCRIRGQVRLGSAVGDNVARDLPTDSTPAHRGGDDEICLSSTLKSPPSSSLWAGAQAVGKPQRPLAYFGSGRRACPWLVQLSTAQPVDCGRPRHPSTRQSPISVDSPVDRHRIGPRASAF